MDFTVKNNVAIISQDQSKGSRNLQKRKKRTLEMFFTRNPLPPSPKNLPTGFISKCFGSPLTKKKKER